MKNAIDLKDFNICKENLENISYYFSKLQLDILNNKNDVMNEISFNTEKVKQLETQILNSKKETDKNYVLFSPVDVQNYSEKNNLSDRMNEYNKILHELNLKLDEILVKEKQLEDAKSYLNAIKTKINNEIIHRNNNEVQECDDLRISLLEYQEIDRKRIARDLHDTTVQNLTNLVHKTELCCKVIDNDTTRVKLELQTMIGTIRNTINELRSIIYDLRPMSLDDLGLVATIEQYVNKLILDYDIVIDFKVINEEVRVLPIINLAIFRVIQEACSNVIKHARAKRIDIKLVYSSDNIEITIIDDGIGFDMEEIKGKDKSNISNFGVSIMQERIYLLSGIMEMESKEGQGTKIFIKVPMFGRMEYGSN